MMRLRLRNTLVVPPDLGIVDGKLGDDGPGPVVDPVDLLHEGNVAPQLLNVSL
jgi:hypothetical protein